MTIDPVCHLCPGLCPYGCPYAMRLPGTSEEELAAAHEPFEAEKDEE